MKALILVGGYGTRMRPLTINCPKAVFPFINKPMVEHQIAALALVGVDQVILAVNYQSDHIKNNLSDLQKKYGIKITYSKEPEAYGTAGPLKFAQTLLKNNNKAGLVFVFNSDIICDFPMKKLLQFHKQHKQQASIVLAKVKDPTRFGVVVTNQEHKVQLFVQKPQQFISNDINAGIYLLNLSVIDRIPEKFCMIQRQIFPQMAVQGKIYAFKLQNDFWNDIGKPIDYLIGQNSYLKYYNLKQKEQCYEGNVCIDKSAKIGKDCKIGPNVVIGPNCDIGEGTRIKDSCLIADVSIKSSAYLRDSIISWGCKIGSWVRIQGLTAIAEQVSIKDEISIINCMILSHKSISTSVKDQILM